MMYWLPLARAPRGALWRASEANASVPGTPARRPGAACSSRDASSTTMSRSMSLQSSARPLPREPIRAAPSTAGSAQRLAVAAASHRDRMSARRGAGGPEVLAVTGQIITRRKPPGQPGIHRRRPPDTRLSGLAGGFVVAVVVVGVVGLPEPPVAAGHQRVGRQPAIVAEVPAD